MRFSNNNFLVFFKDKKTAALVTEIIRKKYPEEKKNLFETVHEISSALKLLKRSYKNKIFFDIIIFELDLSIPINTRKKFINWISGYQANHEWILVTNNAKLKGEDKRIVEDNRMFLIAESVWRLSPF